MGHTSNYIVRLPHPRAQNSTVGLGFIVDDSHIVTCAHVVNVTLGLDPLVQDHPGREARVAFRLPLNGDVIREAQPTDCWDPPPIAGVANGDIAGLEIVGERLPAAIVPARLDDRTSVGSTVHIFGYPTYSNRPAGGSVEATLESEVTGGLLQLSSQ